VLCRMRRRRNPFEEEKKEESVQEGRALRLLETSLSNVISKLNVALMLI
jgi:hypothetical protein